MPFHNNFYKINQLYILIKKQMIVVKTNNQLFMKVYYHKTLIKMIIIPQHKV